MLLKTPGGLRGLALALLATALAVAAVACGGTPEERVVEVEKPVIVEKEVIKEVPVERVVEKQVVKEVPVERVVEKKVVQTVEVQVVVTPTPRPKETIRFHDGQWQSLWINNAIAMYIIEKGYGYPVESVEGTTPTMQVALPRGDLDVNMEMWRVNILDWVNEQVSKRTIIDLGQIFETSTQGWYVPTYVIEGDPERGIQPMAPDLKSVFDLPKYKDLFKDPEDPSKGLFINCIIGWRCQQINRIKLATYGLDDDFNVVEPGAAAGLDAAIAGAYKRGEPVLAYYWEPTWLLGAYKMTLLEEPPYTKECWAKVQEALTNYKEGERNAAEEACAYESFDVHKFASTKLLDKAPEVTTFLSKMFLGTQRINELAAYMELEEKTADETAVYFLQNFEDQWREWVPDDVFQRVKESLP